MVYLGMGMDRNKKNRMEIKGLIKESLGEIRLT
jgi:hypothetical protein